MMVYCVDIDGVLTIETEGYTAKDFSKRTPNLKAINFVKDLFLKGHRIILFTARKSTDKGVVEATKAWLEKHDVLYHELCFDKPIADIYIDDKATCWFPEGRKLFVQVVENCPSLIFYCYLHTEVVPVEKVSKLPDKLIICYNLPSPRWSATATGEFLRDVDLKEEALFYVNQSLKHRRGWMRWSK